MVELVLYVVACVLLVLAAFGVGVGRVSLGWLGLAIIAVTALLLPHLG
jgi:hypothetical protein